MLDVFMSCMRRADAGDLPAADWLADKPQKYFEAVNMTYKHWLKQVLDKDQLGHFEDICSKAGIRHYEERHRAQIRAQYDQRREALQQSAEAWQQALSAGAIDQIVLAGSSLFAALDELWEENYARFSSDLGVTKEAIVDELIRLIEQHAAQLWQQVSTSRKAYLELRQIMVAVRDNRIPAEFTGSDIVRVLPKEVKLPFPEGWNEQTARYLDDPHLRDFDTAAELQPGEDHRRAVEACQNNTWVEAAILLAYTRSSKAAWREIGELLRKGLQEVVVAHRSSLAANSSHD